MSKKEKKRIYVNFSTMVQQLAYDYFSQAPWWIRVSLFNAFKLNL